MFSDVENKILKELRKNKMNGIVDILKFAIAKEYDNMSGEAVRRIEILEKFQANCSGIRSIQTGMIHCLYKFYKC